MVRNIAGPRAGGHSRGGGRGEETGLEDERNGGRIPAATGGIIASRGGIQLIEQGKIIGAIGCVPIRRMGWSGRRGRQWSTNCR